ncbi:hypothetical protein LTR28_005300 [Elasticomyces elasticus]|nr:hypothetical protein LTR28_005300 [Elasticomyces elasticus]
MPKAYNAIKTAVIAEAIKNGGVLKKKQIKEISRIDAVKASRLCDYFGLFEEGGSDGREGEVGGGEKCTGDEDEADFEIDYVYKGDQ